MELPVLLSSTIVKGIQLCLSFLPPPIFNKAVLWLPAMKSPLFLFKKDLSFIYQSSIHRVLFFVGCYMNGGEGGKGGHSQHS